MEEKKPKYLNHLAYESFNRKFSSFYFSELYIIKGFFIALCLSLFIYLEHFGLHVRLLDTLFGLIGFYTLLRCETRTFAWSGFFVGIFWFYWISFSFRYYELTMLMPLVILGIGLIYGFLFWGIGFFAKNHYLRAFLLFCFTFFAPFGFNWLKPELVFINSYFSTNLYFFAAVLLVLAVRTFWVWRVLALLVLVFLPYFFKAPPNTLPSLHASLAQPYLDQNKKWNKAYRQEIIRSNLDFIRIAIAAKKDLVVLPESAFPLYLSRDEQTLEILQNLSEQITILTGALHVRDNKIYNASYMFKNGDYKIANKVVLVPFGERIPLPKFARGFINKLFFDGAEDYESAQSVSDFEIKGYTFRNAICFEATTDRLFEANPKYMIAISNNAWFSPSIEPTLQNLLLKLYAKKYNTIIYHSANAGKSGIIIP